MSPDAASDSQGPTLADELHRYLVETGLKSTRQRQLIANVFARTTEHISVDELLAAVKAQDPAIGYATVYRTLKLLVHAGLATVRQFGDGHSRFELRSKDHHDHLICAECGFVLEFFSEEIEELQSVVAQEHGFEVERHKLELYGVCEERLGNRPCPRAAEMGGIGGAGRAVVRNEPDGERPPGVARRDIPAAFADYLREAKLKSTRQRDLIVELFAASEDHVNVEELLAKVNKIEPNIGYATVYRTLKLLVKAGLAAARRFGDGQTRFEAREDEHHDHMICVDSGRIIEFRNDDIEELQEVEALRHGFKLLRHKHELYGRLADPERGED